MKISVSALLTISTLIILTFTGCNSFNTQNQDQAQEKKTIDERKFEHHAKGMEHLRAGDFDQAIEEFNKATELDNDYTSAFMNRGVAYSNKKLYARALIDFNRVIELEPETAADAYYNRGIAYHFMDKNEKAIKDYSKAIEIAPQNIVAYLNRAIAYRQEGEYDKALEDLNIAIERIPNDPRAYYQKAIIYHAKDANEKEITAHKKAAELGYKTSQKWLEEKNIEYKKPNDESTEKDITNTK